MKPVLFVSFSGGRTSGYMCWWLLQNKADEYDLRFVFANTGCEANERTHPGSELSTLEFVDRCDREWGLNLTWVEAVTSMTHGVGVRHKVVNYETASRNGEPFEQFIKFAGVPNAAFNQCSERLKSLPMESYRKSLGFSGKHLTAVGIRSDEIDRMSPTAREKGLIYPLIQWTQVTAAEVRHWWADQPFDLGVPEHHGNCCVGIPCWKKSDLKLWTIAKNNPEWFDLADRMEREHSLLKCDEKPRYFFRRHRSTQDILREAQQHRFREFVDHKPELQLGMFAPENLEDDDCGASTCEIQ